MKEEEGKEEQSDCNSPSLPTLPDEILYEILTHVALDDLLRRCRWVCRYWNSLSYDSTFKRLHCQRTQSVSGYLIQYLTKNRFHTNFVHSIASSPSSISLNFMPMKTITIKASSCQAQGLLCCVSNDNHSPQSYYVCKPVTERWTRIPNPKTGCYNERMAIVVKKSNPLHYKIIRFSHCTKDLGLQYCEIFDSKNWAWKMHLEFKNLPYSIRFQYLEPEVLLHGSFHWLSFFGKEKHIFVFDVDEENWRLIMLPQSQSSSGGGEEVEAMNCDIRIDKKLVNCEGHLGLLYTPRMPWKESCSWIELWVMEDYLKETWKKKYRLSLRPLYQMVGGCFILAMDTMHNILLRTFDKLIWYNCISGVPTKVKKLEDPIITSFCYIHPFNSDSVPCDLGPKEIPKEEEK